MWDELMCTVKPILRVSKLNHSNTLPIDDWIEYHSAHLSRIYNVVVSQLDWDASGGIIAKPVNSAEN
jgi:hypothetical protein